MESQNIFAKKNKKRSHAQFSQQYEKGSIFECGKRLKDSCMTSQLFSPMTNLYNKDCSVLLGQDCYNQQINEDNYYQQQQQFGCQDSLYQPLYQCQTEPQNEWNYNNNINSSNNNQQQFMQQQYEQQNQNYNGHMFEIRSAFMDNEESQQMNNQREFSQLDVEGEDLGQMSSIIENEKSNLIYNKQQYMATVREQQYFQGKDFRCATNISKMSGSSA